MTGYHKLEECLECRCRMYISLSTQKAIIPGFGDFFISLFLT
jgi:hypothetical protein